MNFIEIIKESLPEVFFSFLGLVTSGNPGEIIMGVLGMIGLFKFAKNFLSIS